MLVRMLKCTWYIGNDAKTKCKDGWCLKFYEVMEEPNCFTEVGFKEMRSKFSTGS
jgi:hypothetical protein